MKKILFHANIRYYLVIRYWFNVDLGVITMKQYSTQFKAPELELSHQMQFILYYVILCYIILYSQREGE